MKNLAFFRLLLVIVGSVPVVAAEDKPLGDPTGWESVLLKPVTLESAFDHSNDALKVRNNGSVVTDKRSLVDLYKLTLKYDISFFDFYDGIDRFKAPVTTKDAVNKNGWQLFFDSFRFVAQGNWSNTASDVSDLAATSVESRSQFTGSVGIRFKACLRELVMRYVVGCERK